MNVILSLAISLAIYLSISYATFLAFNIVIGSVKRNMISISIIKIIMLCAVIYLFKLLVDKNIEIYINYFLYGVMAGFVIVVLIVLFGTNNK